MVNKDKLRVIKKDYQVMFPFTLVVVYQKDGKMLEMLHTASLRFPELKDIIVDPDHGPLACFVTYGRETGNSYMFINKEFSQELLVHESYHIVFGLFTSIGSPVSNDTEELFAYTLQFVYKELYNICTKQLKLPMKISI